MTIDHRRILRPSEPPAATSERPSDPFELWRLTPLSLEEFSALGTADSELSLEQLRYLASFNLLAPTSHNTVPQRFLFSSAENAIEIWLDRAVILSASDPVGRQASISVGCGIANLLHAARRYGFDATTETYDAPSPAVLPPRAGEPRYVRVARVQFVRWATLEAEAMLTAMLQRRTVRADYNVCVALPAQLAESLRKLMGSRYQELEFHLSSDTASINFLAELQELADSIFLNNEDFTSELGRWLIDNESDSLLGMRGREYGMSDELTHSLRARLQSEIRLAPHEVSGLARGGNIGIRSSSAVGIIVVPQDDLRHRVLAGRAFEDLALMLHQHAFVTAMHAGITEMESANLALQAHLTTRGRPVVVFRTGQPLEPNDARRPHSGRPSVTDVTLSENLLSLPSERDAS